MNIETAKKKLTEMKDKTFYLKGEPEKVDDFTINGRIVIIYTNKTHRKCQLDNLQGHLDLYKKNPPAKNVELAPVAVQQAPQPAKVVHNTSGHVEALHKIYLTRDFKRFKNILGNRILNQAKIKRIAADIKAGCNMLPWCPIIVDEKMNVIDGQHRLAVAKAMNENIYYTIREQATLHEIARMNSNTERWKGSDFIHCYSSQGNAHYNGLKDFISQYHFPLGVAITLLSAGKIGQGGLTTEKEQFEKGQFKISHLPEATRLAEQVNKFKVHPAHNSRGFITAIQLLMNGQLCNFDHLLKKFEKDPAALPICSTHKEYLTALEALYNKDAKYRTTIF
jgi:hypothetical protein